MRPAFRLAVVAAALALATPGAHAESPGSQRNACTPDAMRLCRGAITNVAATTSCLVAHRAALSATCRGVFAFAEPAADRTPPARADSERTRPIRTHPVRPLVARAGSARVYRRVRVARRVAPYHIPRFDQAEAEAEVHAQYRYRAPYLPYWVFP